MLSTLQYHHIVVSGGVNLHSEMATCIQLSVTHFPCGEYEYAIQETSVPLKKSILALFITKNGLLVMRPFER